MNISSAIYAAWRKCSVESVNYGNINLNNEIKMQLYSFFSSIFEGTLTSRGNSHYTKVMKYMIGHLWEMRTLNNVMLLKKRF